MCAISLLYKPIKTKHMKTNENEKKELIKKLKAEANKAMSKVITSTFDTNERNRAMLQIHQLLSAKIKEVVELS